MIDTEWIQLVQSIGFPMAVTGWFMLRTETVVKNNTDALVRVHEAITKCEKKN